MQSTYELKTSDLIERVAQLSQRSAVRKLIILISKVLLDDGNRIVNPQGIFKSSAILCVQEFLLIGCFRVRKNRVVIFC